MFSGVTFWEKNKSSKSKSNQKKSPIVKHELHDQEEQLPFNFNFENDEEEYIRKQTEEDDRKFKEVERKFEEELLKKQLEQKNPVIHVSKKNESNKAINDFMNKAIKQIAEVSQHVRVDDVVENFLKKNK